RSTCERTAQPRSRYSARLKRGVASTAASRSSGSRASSAALDAERLYAKRFRAYDADLDYYRFYRLRTTRMKLFDERVLGGGTFVTVRVGPSGRIAWERTERYVGGE